MKIEGIIRELDSFKRKRRRKRTLYSLVLGLVGSAALAGALAWDYASSRISGLEEENTALEKELSRTEEEKDKFENLYKEYRPFDWEDPEIWGRYVGGFFATLEEDIFGDQLYIVAGDHKLAANQVYNAMREHFGWKEKNWPGFMRAFERTYLNDILNPKPDMQESGGPRCFIVYESLAPDWYEILADPENTDYESHRKGFEFLINKFIHSGKKGIIQSDGNINHMGRSFAEHFESEIKTTARQRTFQRRVTQLFKWTYDFLEGTKGEFKLVFEEVPEDMPPGYK